MAAPTEVVCAGGTKRDGPIENRSMSARIYSSLWEHSNATRLRIRPTISYNLADPSAIHLQPELVAEVHHIGAGTNDKEEAVARQKKSP